MHISRPVGLRQEEGWGGGREQNMLRLTQSSAYLDVGPQILLLASARGLLHRLRVRVADKAFNYT